MVIYESFNSCFDMSILMPKLCLFRRNNVAAIIEMKSENEKEY